MKHHASLTHDDLARVFVPEVPVTERIGLELECALVDPQSGRSSDYRRSAALLRAAACEFDGEPIQERGCLLGVALPTGAQFSLELGGALEYSSTPFVSLTELVDVTRRDMSAMAELAAQHGIAIMPAGMLPFTPASGIPWIPKHRIGIMKSYFRRLGAVASCAEEVMGLTLSTQTSLDYVTEQDLLEKLRLLVMVTPIAAAMFVNSPLQDGQVTGLLSRRMDLWRHVDPRRCGVLACATSRDLSIERVIEWALSLPMIYRTHGQDQVAAPDQAFGQLITSGFGDGTLPTAADWQSHLSQVWPHVRLRQTLELRACDGLSWWAFAAGPAFWVGLAYHGPARRRALSIVDGLTAAQLETITDDVARKGLVASAAGRTVAEVAEELLDLSRSGLEARVACGTEPASVVDLLDPLREVIRTGVTAAQHCVAEWEGPFRRRPSALVSTYRI